ncbi:DUF177 domain-containing protein [Sandarakinorhabdus sp.]|uniref:YceD family protein n=1 Tax=Sandarakinorhabdus sp. TaxID=1916663 RepID=UPI0028A79841|nr:DUF177 domain-containing protein [Sandarakinorhabdus sp.]
MSNAAPEFSHIVRAHEIGSPKQHMLEADAGERAALATRFILLSLDRLTAALEVKRESRGIRITGEVNGAGNQPCVASGEPVPFLVKERIALLLTEATPGGGEIELSSADLEVEPLDGDIVDLGEIAAQALALGLDPYPRLPVSVPGVISEDEAVALRSPFAVLKKS